MLPELKNNRLISSAFGEEVDCVPVWVMRQAGRYLPEFREERMKYDFFTMCTTPEVACKITLQPLQRFELDAAIMFSDILVIPKALGMEIIMKPGEGPVFTKPLETIGDLDRLPEASSICRNLIPDFEGFRLTRKTLDGKVPLIGFAGAPWTIMCYMVEGKGSKTMSKSKRWLYESPAESHCLLKKITDATIIYLKKLIDEGAQMLQIFESAAEHLNIELFVIFCIPYLKQIYDELKKYMTESEGTPRIPMVIFPKGGHYALREVAKLDYEVIGIDWTVDPIIARDMVGPNKTLQGNLDPCALYGSKESIEIAVKEMLRKFGRKKYIANLGHGMYPDMKPESVETFVNAVHKYSKLPQ